MKDRKIVVYTNIILQKKMQWLILLIVTIILYGKTISYDYNLDDYIITDSLDGKINKIQDLLSLFNLSYNNADYRPIVFLSFGIEHLLIGEFNASVSHAVNCILYFLICISGLKLMNLFLGEENSLLVFLAVLLFSVHPINTEVVSSIKCRDNLLSMLLSINSSIFFLKYFKENKQIYYLAISTLLLLIALLSKLDAFGFCFLYIGYLVFILRERKINKIVSVIILIIIVSIAYSTFKEEAMIKHLATPLTPKVTFTENPLAVDFTITNRFIAFTNTLSYYFTKLTYISSSRYYYGYNRYDILSSNSISFYVGILIIISILTLFIYGVIRKNNVVVLTIIGIVTLGSYAANFLVPVAGIIADRYIFMVNLFFCLLIVYIIQYILYNRNFRNYFTYTILGIIFIFSLISFVRIGAWKNFRTLINTDAPKLYSSYEAMRIASSAYFEEYKKSEAINDLEQAIFYAEKGNAVYPKNTLLHLLSGQFYFKKNDFDNSIQHFIVVTKNDTSLSEPLVYLGDTYYAKNNFDSSLFYYQLALKKVPKNAELINNISTVYFEKGEKENCLQFNYDLLKKDSTLYAAYENLGYYFLSEKDTAKARSYFKQGEKHGLKPVNINSLK